MASQKVRERLAHDIGTWLTDGLISAETHALLRERYEVARFGLGQAIKYLGIAGGGLAVVGILGLIAALSESQGVVAFLLLAFGIALTWFGIRIANDRLGRYEMSSKVVMLLGVVAAISGLCVALDALGVKSEKYVILVGMIVIPSIGFLAYRFRNMLLMNLGLLLFFHWVGSWTAMFGRSTYAMNIQDPRWMSLAALSAIVCGIYHERILQRRTGRFFQAYQVWGLIYLNVSLLILSIEARADSFDALGNPTFALVILMWPLIWGCVAITQIFVGARLHNALFTAFGVTALILNMYTRYFEYFWDKTHQGVFFLVGGLVLVAMGIAAELAMKRPRRSGA